MKHYFVLIKENLIIIIKSAKNEYLIKTTCTHRNNFANQLLYIEVCNTQLLYTNQWIVDSRATCYMAYDKNVFINYKPIFSSQFAYTIDGT